MVKLFWIMKSSIFWWFVSIITRVLPLSALVTIVILFYFIAYVLNFFSNDSCLVFCVVHFSFCVLSFFISICNVCATACPMYVCSCGLIRFIAVSASIAKV